MKENGPPRFNGSRFVGVDNSNKEGGSSRKYSPSEGCPVGGVAGEGWIKREGSVQAASVFSSGCFRVQFRPISPGGRRNA
ncbi:hypothetical protein SUGI_1229050 [Cryptomeria japonica]|uniref:Uncharacterized protein n=1 Tax=Cryptomeria japonica TaxID=3369 RepID=A0AAD3NN40_CRYJA|nr:hypothetical protein SUGI_1229050 [Cryptomeria japonica]